MAANANIIGRKLFAVLCTLVLVFSCIPITHSVAIADELSANAESSTPVDPCSSSHSWDGGVVTTAPTTDSTGVRTYTCTVCGTSYTEEIPKLPWELESVGIDGVWTIDMFGNFQERVSKSPVPDGESIKATISEPGGRLRIRLQEVYKASDGSMNTVLQGTPGWNDPEDGAISFYSDNPSIVGVGTTDGILEAKSNSSDAGVQIGVRGSIEGKSFDNYAATIYTTNQSSGSDDPGSGGSSGGGSGSGGGDDTSGGSGSGGGGGDSGGGSGSGDGGDSGGGGNSGTSPVEIPDIPTEVTNKLVAEIGIAGLYTTDAHGAWFINEERSNIITQQGGKLRIMLYQVERSKYKTYKESDDRWITVNQRYYSSDPSIISVDNSGTVTAHGNGTATIHVFGDGGLYTSINITAENQDNADVVSMHIYDEVGNDVTGSNLTMGSESDGSRYRQYYARVQFIDGTTASTIPDAPDYDKNRVEQRLSDGRLTWKVNNEDVGFVNAESGRFKALDDGIVKIEAHYGTASAFVWMQINTGRYSDAHNPSDSLTIKVCYQERGGDVFYDQTYSADEFSSWGLITESYTLTQSGGKYVFDVATGVPIKTVCEHVPIDTSKILGFYFEANDGANPGFISYEQFVETPRYCFPNYDLGGSFQEAYTVPTVLAIADNWMPNTVSSPYDTLNSGTRFRLVFGSVGRTDDLTNKSLKYINTLIIMLEGSPPAQQENKEEAKETDKDKEDQKNSGSGVAGNTGDNGGNSGNNVATNDGSNTNSVPISGGTGAENRPAQLSSMPIDSIVLPEENDIQQGDEGGSEEGAESSWQVFQMMSKDKSELDPVVIENVLAPIMGPLTCVVFVIGGLVTFLFYRRELKKPVEHLVLR